MYDIEGEDIRLTRGDSFLLRVRFKGRAIANGASAVLCVKERRRGAEVLLAKTSAVEDNQAFFRFEPEDTQELPARNCRYSLRVTDGDGNVFTPIEGGAFCVSEAV